MIIVGSLCVLLGSLRASGKSSLSLDPSSFTYHRAECGRTPPEHSVSCSINTLDP